jgi:glycosyltransferase involved in cell wall biosynthesis
LKKQKILFVVRQLGSSGGVERRVDQLSKSQLQKKFDIQVFSFLGILETYETPKNKLLLGIDYLKRVIKITVAIRKEKPDIIHAFDLESGLYVSLALKLLNNKKIRFISGFGAQKIYDQRIKKIISRKFFQPDLFICNSNEGKASLTQASNNKIPVQVIYNGFTPLIKETITKPDWYKDGYKYVGLVSKFDDYKKAERIFELAEKLSLDSKIIFVVAGTGRDYKKAVETYKSNPDFQKKIILLGIVQDAWTLIPWIDIGILVSDEEGFPTVLIEYLSFAKNIVSTSCGESNFILNNGKAGTLINPYNSNRFIEVIEKTCKAEIKNEEGYNWYLQNFTFEHMLSQYEKVYSQLN